MKKQVQVVNHGKMFGSEKWFTFYCGHCGDQLTAQQEKCPCGCVAVWDAK